MFANPRELYQEAEEKNLAIGAFNTNNMEVTQAIVSAANELSSPVIIQTTPSAIEYAGLKEIFNIARTLIDDSPVKMSIHLDHAKSVNIIRECLEVGYKSVMFDGSDLLFENNVAETKKIVDMAHKVGAIVEAEIGVVGRGEEGREFVRQKMTDPNEARDFVRLTGIDALAVSIGNVHGAPDGETINIDLLREINEIVDVPLVLHGASGLNPNDIRNAINTGIRKINIDTQIRQAFKKSLQENVDNENLDFRDFLNEAKDDVKSVVLKYLKLFNGIE